MYAYRINNAVLNLRLDKRSPVRWELFDLSMTMFLDLLHLPILAPSDKVDPEPLPSPAATASNTVQIGVNVLGNVEIDYGTNLLNINPARRNIR